MEIRKRKRENDKGILYERIKTIAKERGGQLISKEFIKAKTKYDFICAEGHKFKLTYDKAYSPRGDWCPYCAGRYGDFQSKYKHIIEELQHGKMLSDYVNSKTKIKAMCSEGHIIEMLPGNLLKGKWCGVCSHTSHGEKAILNFLNEHSIKFERQYRFEDLKGSRNSLPFDFAIFNDDGSLRCLVEYDGEQHFRPLRHSNRKEENLKKHLQVVENDKKKNEYCKKNNIWLIRISFFDVDERRILNLQRDINKRLSKELLENQEYKLSPDGDSQLSFPF